MLMIDFKSNFKLQFITNQTEKFSHLESAILALKGGCKWIQLRVKSKDILKDRENIIDTARQLKAICEDYDAIFIIDDYVDICQEVGASGVHLGKNDMPIIEARKILSKNFIIGGTANTFEDMKYIYMQGADYIGLGPFSFTKTKEKLAQILGLAGYKDLINKKNLSEINIPIVAIGGIKYEDIEDIMNTGVDGIAISGEIIHSTDPTETTKKIVQKLKK